MRTGWLLVLLLLVGCVETQQKQIGFGPVQVAEYIYSVVAEELLTQNARYTKRALDSVSVMYMGEDTYMGYVFMTVTDVASGVSSFRRVLVWAVVTEDKITWEEH